MAQSELSQAEQFAKRQFDFVIVGGGTAGLAVAARLAENASLTVGVLEAGERADGNDQINIPAFSGRPLGGPLDWHFKTEPQGALAGRELVWNRGKVLGGSSALNYMVWNRGCKEDYDAWEELGNPGWGWESLLPYFKKSETFHPPPASHRDKYQSTYNSPSPFLGDSGPIHVSYTADYSPTHAYWHATLNSLGIETNRGHLNGSNVGVWTNISALNPESGGRSYAAHYLGPPPPANLHILTGALAQEVVLEQQHQQQGGESEWTATGVKFSHGGQTFTVSAKREVILSAGAIQSPQLLELSGVGRAEVLAAAGIPVKVDSPNVGENLRDHPMTPLVFEVDPTMAQIEDLLDESVLAAALEQYRRDRTGLLTILPSAMSYLPFSQFTPQAVLNDMQAKSKELLAHFSSDEKLIILSRQFSPETKLGQMEYVFELGNWNPTFQPDRSDGKRYCSMVVILQYPFSKGSVHIRRLDSDGSESDAKLTASLPPVIDPQYYAGPHGELDLEAMVHGVRFGQEICRTKPVADIIRGPAHPSKPVTNEEEVRAWVAQNTITCWHPIGTCAMGGSGGKAAGVVDSRLRVYGVEGLRVVDASVMPLHISAHPQATVYAIAEKAADMIREDMLVS